MHCRTHFYDVSISLQYRAKPSQISACRDKNLEFRLILLLVPPIRTKLWDAGHREKSSYAFFPQGTKKSKVSSGVTL